MGTYDLKNKVALITGSSRGIGLATARALASRGAKIALNARSADKLASAEKQLKSEGFDVISVQADVSDPESCRTMIESVISGFGGLDILVNNAGVSMRSNFEDLTAETCREIIGVNLLGCIYPTLYAIPQIKANKGSLVFISSIAGLIGLPTGSLYCATKSALRGLADSLRCELAPEGVHVGVVYVGFTENDPEKTVIGSGGERISPGRPAHVTQADTGKKIADVIQHRSREALLSPIGKFAAAASRISPSAVETAIILSRKFNISELVGIR
ncbi:MAG: SDR family oxidoreductase [bacterium]